MYYLNENNAKEHVYPIYGRRFLAYRWYKPLLTGTVWFIMYLLLYMVLMVAVWAVNGVAVSSPDLDALDHAIVLSYDEMDVSNWMQNVMSFGGAAVMIPALFLAVLIVRDRPFSSYSSSMGGWRHSVFWSVLPVAFLCKGIPILFKELVIDHQASNFEIKFTLASFILITLLGPLQCIAEEYIFRGLLMQSLGSWVRLPVLAVVLQAAVFSLEHPYNNTGKASIFIAGLTFGLAAWICRGVEASSALHVVNNMTIFYLSGLNMAQIGTEIDTIALVIELASGLMFVLCLLILRWRTDWFSKVKKDDVSIANTKYEEKKAKKAAKKAAGKTAGQEEPVSVSEPGGKHFKSS